MQTKLACAELPDKCPNLSFLRKMSLRMTSTIHLILRPWQMMTPPSQVEQSFNADEDEEVCPVCGDTPCDWVSFGDQIKRQIKLLYFHEINKDGKEEIVDGDAKS